MGMGQYLWIPYFSGMNIHLPAILMWTTGVQGFDTLPYLTTFIIELDDGKIYRKALYLMVKTNGFPVKFPLNQSNDFNQETLNGIWATKVEVQHSWFYIIKNINIYSQKRDFDIVWALGRSSAPFSESRIDQQQSFPTGCRISQQYHHIIQNASHSRPRETMKDDSDILRSRGLENVHDRPRSWSHIRNSSE